MDTIAAIATPTGKGGVGIIRVSGPDAVVVLQQLCPKLKTIEPRRVHFTPILDPNTQHPVDDACVIYFKAPHSYTGEDVVEFQTHGSPQVLKTVLQLAIAQHCRLATAGEFTKRAFINGKLELTQAEAVADLIDAQTETAHAVALSHLQGRLWHHISHIRKQLMIYLEQMEGAIDFPEEVPRIPKDQLQAGLQIILDTIQTIIENEDYGMMAKTGVNVVIIGCPNVGKSSLLNALLGYQRAIVTDIAGTTRDFIDARIELNGIQFNITDTAGIREQNTDVIEAMGIQKIDQVIQNAHVVLWVLDGTIALRQEDISCLKRIPDTAILYALINKSDQEQRIDSQTVQHAIHDKAQASQIVPLNTITPDGLAPLKEALKTDITSKIDALDKELLCSVRQMQCIKEVTAHLKHALGNINAGFEEDVLTIDIKHAIFKLGEITGDEITEEVLDGIFAKFCVGK